VKTTEYLFHPTGTDEMLVVTDRAKYRRRSIRLDRLELPHSLGVPDQEKIGVAAASTEKVLAGGLIGSSSIIPISGRICSWDRSKRCSPVLSCTERAVVEPRRLVMISGAPE